jgi:hypothetical protein
MPSLLRPLLDDGCAGSADAVGDTAGAAPVSLPAVEPALAVADDVDLDTGDEVEEDDGLIQKPVSFLPF